MPAIKKTKATEPYLKTLGLDNVDAETEISEEQINKAFKKLSLITHPDKATVNEEDRLKRALTKEEIEAINAKFLAIKAARDSLIALANSPAPNAPPAPNNPAPNTNANSNAQAKAAAQDAAQRQFASAQQPSSGLGVMKIRHMPYFISIVPVVKMVSIIDEFNKFVAEKTQKPQPTQTVDQSTIKSREIQPFAPGQVSPNPEPESQPEYQPEDFKHDVFQIKNKQTGRNITVHVLTFPDEKSMEQFLDRLLGYNLATIFSEATSPQAAASPIKQAARPAIEQAARPAAITDKFRQAITDGREPKEPAEPSQRPSPKGGR